MPVGVHLKFCPLKLFHICVLGARASFFLHFFLLPFSLFFLAFRFLFVVVRLMVCNFMLWKNQRTDCLTLCYSPHIIPLCGIREKMKSLYKNNNRLICTESVRFSPIFCSVCSLFTFIFFSALA